MVTDFFSVNAPEVIERLVGEFNTQGDGALVVNTRTNLIKMLLPKIPFYFSTHRTGHKPRVALKVKGNIGALLPALAGNEPQWLFAPRFDKKPAVRLSFKRAIKVAIQRDASLPVGDALRNFVATI